MWEYILDGMFGTSGLIEWVEVLALVGGDGEVRPLTLFLEFLISLFHLMSILMNL